MISYGEDEREELSPRLREKVGVSLMMRIALQFYQQKQALTITELEIETALSNSILQDLLNTLEQGGLLAELQGDELRYQPAQDIANISVSSVLTCLRTTQKSQEMAVTVASDANRLLDELEKLQQSTLQDVSLRQLVSGIDKT